MKADGVVFSTISEEFAAELKAAFQFLEDDWVSDVAKKGIDGKAALEYYRSLITDSPS